MLGVNYENLVYVERGSMQTHVGYSYIFFLLFCRPAHRSCDYIALLLIFLKGPIHFMKFKQSIKMLENGNYITGRANNFRQ